MCNDCGNSGIVSYVNSIYLKNCACDHGKMLTQKENLIGSVWFIVMLVCMCITIFFGLR